MALRHKVLLTAAWAVIWIAEPAPARQLSGTINLADVGGTLPGVSFTGVGSRDNSGFAVAPAGDVNGDSLDDILIGSQQMGVMTQAGLTYLIDGQPVPEPRSLALVSLAGLLVTAVSLRRRRRRFA
jgi:hypothetical protein